MATQESEIRSVKPKAKGRKKKGHLPKQLIVNNKLYVEKPNIHSHTISRTNHFLKKYGTNNFPELRNAIVEAEKIKGDIKMDKGTKKKKVKEILDEAWKNTDPEDIRNRKIKVNKTYGLKLHFLHPSNDDIEKYKKVQNGVQKFEDLKREFFGEWNIDQKTPSSELAKNYDKVSEKLTILQQQAGIEKKRVKSEARGASLSSLQLNPNAEEFVPKTQKDP